MDAAPKDAEPSLTVVGIGASAGGLDALKKFFGRVPEDSGLAYVVVVHLSPDHESKLADLLQVPARIPIAQVNEDTQLERDHAYVIPPNRNLATIDSQLRVEPLEARRGARAPIDHFFTTLAETHGDAAVGIVLSGTGSDGARGIRRIKEESGLTLVQDPNEAHYDGMPRSAIATGLVDMVLPVAEMPLQAMRYAHTQPKLEVPVDGEELSQSQIDLLHKVFAQLRARTGRDYTRYKRSTLIRRIRRRMQIRHLDDAYAYLALLGAEHEEARALSDELLITVTSFFRDPEVYAALERDVLPKIFADKTGADQVRVWSVGCASGEEAYSLAMLLVEQMDTLDEPPQIQVFASDLHAHAIARAREGIYPDTIAADVSPKRIGRFFEKMDGSYRIKRELRDTVVFAPHNLLGDPPFSHLDLVACRNLLIYLQRDAQHDVLDVFHYALRPRGYLVLGTSETIDRSDQFATVDKRACIFRRNPGSPSERQVPAFRVRQQMPHRDGEPTVAAVPLQTSGALHHELVQQFAPPSILLSGDDHTVVHVSADAGRYLRVPGGVVTSSLIKLVRDELRVDLRDVLSGAANGEALQSRPIAMEIDGRPRQIVIRAQPASRADERHLTLVFFQEWDASEASPLAPREASDAAVVALEAELERTKQRMQAVIEEYETSQEEMRAGNEELQSTNEELRSTMEELETGKEELQSINEELATLNQENRHRVDELSQLTDDLQNLLASTRIATFFLDRKLRILRFTPTVEEIFNLQPGDRGRPLSDLTHQLGYDNLVDDAKRVLSSLVTVEREVQHEDGRWYLLRTLPYRTTEDRIDGVVITFVDVTALKRAEADLRAAQESLTLALDAAEMGTWDLDVPSGRTTRRNARHDRIFGYEKPLDEYEWSVEILREHVLEEDRGAFDAAYERARQGGRLDVDVRVRRGDGATRWIRKIGRVHRDDSGRAVRMAGVVVDHTTEKEWYTALEQRVTERTAQVRELVGRLSRAEQEERRRVSQVLHDDLQQLLYGVQMKLGVLRADMEEAKRDPDVDALRDASARLADAIEMTRRLTIDMSPPVLKKGRLGEAVGWLVGQMKDLHGLDVKVDARADVEIEDDDVRYLLFQVVRELLFNVAKHAGTTRAEVSLGGTDGLVEVEVADDGNGFDPAKVDLEQGPGFGLRSAAERVRFIGGELVIDAAPGKGSRILVRAPTGPG